MNKRAGYPPGVPCWVDAEYPDPDAAAAFYGGLFGWEFEDRMPAEAPGQYLVARLRSRDVGAVSSLPSGSAPRPPAWNTYVCVDSADDSAAGVAEAGGSVLDAPSAFGDAGRTAVFADPAGAEFRVWEPGTHQGAQVVNEPGSWNWSDLNTPDTATAREFYPAVFGWEPMPVDFGYGESWMWRLPGYAEHLEDKDPGLRERHAEAGAPEGFSDAVGWLLPAEEGVPAHWAVTFAVDGTDAVTAKAASLGADIVAPPFDAGPTRVAMLRDPQGAVFTVSTYTPSDSA